ncbi:MAG: hypothetical protein ABI480_16570 [Chitinophagaceae bacterium]
MVKSKFSIFVYGGILFALFFIAIPFYFIAQTQRSGESDEKYLTFIFFPLFSLVFTFIYGRFIYFITIDGDIISIRSIFKKRLITTTDIHQIDLFAQENLYSRARRSELAIRIDLQNGGKIILADTFYSNSHIIKKTLEENFSSKIKPYKIERPALSVSGFIDTEPEKFGGSPFLSITGLMPILLITVMSVLVITSTTADRSFALLTEAAIIFIFLIPLFGLQFHYFLISDRTLVVKNYLLPWVKKTYDLDDVIEANREKRYRQPYCLRISTRDFRSKKYAAASLQQQTWKRLKLKLISLGIYYVG